MVNTALSVTGKAEKNNPKPLRGNKIMTLISTADLKRKLQTLKGHRRTYANSHDELPYIEMEIKNLERILAERKH